jgi:transcriptional regulator with XRE-family HTH domain
MTEAPQTSATVPQWTLGDRMKKAREHAGLKQSELAEITGIGRSTMPTYETGKVIPARPVLLSWAVATGVPLSWLMHGDADPGPPDGGTPLFPQVRRGAHPTSLEPRKYASFPRIPRSPLTAGAAA